MNVLKKPIMSTQALKTDREFQVRTFNTNLQVLFALVGHIHATPTEVSELERNRVYQRNLLKIINFLYIAGPKERLKKEKEVFMELVDIVDDDL